MSRTNAAALLSYEGIVNGLRNETPLRTKMKLAWLAFTLSLAFTARGEEIPKFYSVEEPGCSRAFEIAASADFQASLSNDGKFDLYIGVVKDGVRHSITFTRDEMREFWSAQAKGKFICVTLAKSKRSEVEDKQLVTDLSAYLFECGLKRVRIHQGLGGGVGVLFDGTRDQANGANPKK
jgi:hypothetical protein